MSAPEKIELYDRSHEECCTRRFRRRESERERSVSFRTCGVLTPAECQILEFNDDAIEIINDETPLKCEKEVEYSRSGTGRKDFFAGTFKNATENEFKILYAIDELNAKIEELKKKLK